MKHIAIYMRVSTKKQDTRSQEADLKRWVEAFAGDEDVKWYRDKATGKTMDRPGWNRLEAGIDAGKVSGVVVWSSFGLLTLMTSRHNRGIQRSTGP